MWDCNCLLLTEESLPENGTNTEICRGGYQDGSSTNLSLHLCVLCNTNHLSCVIYSCCFSVCNTFPTSLLSLGRINHFLFSFTHPSFLLLNIALITLLYSYFYIFSPPLSEKDLPEGRGEKLLLIFVFVSLALSIIIMLKICLLSK